MKLRIELKDHAKSQIRLCQDAKAYPEPSISASQILNLKFLNLILNCL
jgi:hypothetical protein